MLHDGGTAGGGLHAAGPASLDGRTLCWAAGSQEAGRTAPMSGFEPILILLIWLGLQWFVLPRLGVPT